VDSDSHRDRPRSGRVDETGLGLDTRRDRSTVLGWEEQRLRFDQARHDERFGSDTDLPIRDRVVYGLYAMKRGWRGRIDVT
jgi:hypothetical protein